MHHGVARILGHGGRQVPCVRKDGSIIPVLIALSAFTHGGATFVVASLTDLPVKIDAYEAAMADAAERLSAAKGAAASTSNRSKTRVLLALLLVALWQSIVFGVSTLSLSTAIDRVAIVCGAQRLRFYAASVAFDARELAVANMMQPWARARLTGEIAAMRAGRNFVRFGPQPSLFYRALFPADPTLSAAMDQLHFESSAGAYGAFVTMTSDETTRVNGLDTFLLTFASVAAGVAITPPATGSNASALAGDARIAYLTSSLPPLDAQLAASVALYLTEATNIAGSASSLDDVAAAVICVLLGAMYLFVRACIFAAAMCGMAHVCTRTGVPHECEHAGAGRSAHAGSPQRLADRHTSNHNSVP